MDTDEHPALHLSGEAAALDLERLIDGVAVGENGGEADRAQMRQGGQRLWVEARGEWIV